MTAHFSRAKQSVRDVSFLKRRKKTENGAQIVRRFEIAAVQGPAHVP